MCAENLYYSSPVKCHEICKCRFKQVCRSSLIGIKRQLSNRLNIIIVKLNSPPKKPTDLAAILNVFLILTDENTSLLYYFHVHGLTHDRTNGLFLLVFKFFLTYGDIAVDEALHMM